MKLMACRASRSTRRIHRVAGVADRSCRWSRPHGKVGDETVEMAEHIVFDADGLFLGVGDGRGMACRGNDEDSTLVLIQTEDIDLATHCGTLTVQSPCADCAKTTHCGAACTEREYTRKDSRHPTDLAACQHAAELANELVLPPTMTGAKRMAPSIRSILHLQAKRPECAGYGVVMGVRHANLRENK